MDKLEFTCVDRVVLADHVLQFAALGEVIDPARGVHGHAGCDGVNGHGDAITLVKVVGCQVPDQCPGVVQGPDPAIWNHGEANTREAELFTIACLDGSGIYLNNCEEM